MNILGIGVDIIQNNRIKEKTIFRFLNVEELLIYNTFTNKDRKLEYAASRWAAKEAIIKATAKKYNFSQITIASNKDNSPIVKINGKLDKNILISIAHEKYYSIAYCVIVK